MGKATRYHRLKILFCTLFMILCLVLLTVQFVNGATIYSDDIPESGVYICEELGIKLSFEGEAISASYADVTIPVWVDYGDNLYFEDGDVYPIATFRWNIENNTLILTFRRAPQWGEKNVPYIFAISE